MPATFVQISFDAIDSILADPKLPSNVFRTWLYLSKLDPFGDRGRRLPTLEQIAFHLKISVDTVRRSLAKLEELGFIVIDHVKTMSFVNSWKNFKSGVENIRAKFFSSQHECKIKSTDKISPASVQDIPHPCNFQTPEPLPDKDCKTSQTIQTFHPPQTQEVEGKNSEFSEQEADDQLSASRDRSNKHITASTLILNEDTKVPPVVVQNKYKIPQELLDRLKEFGVNVSENVIAQISRHHISQSYGAIAHVENTFETIKDPTAIFLYQLPKQKIEKMGQLYSDEILIKKRKEWEEIDKERAQGVKPLSEIITGLEAFKKALLKKSVAARIKKTGLPAAPS